MCLAAAKSTGGFRGALGGPGRGPGAGGWGLASPVIAGRTKGARCACRGWGLTFARHDLRQLQSAQRCGGNAGHADRNRTHADRWPMVVFSEGLESADGQRVLAAGRIATPRLRIRLQLRILHHPRVEIVGLRLKRQVLAIRRRNRPRRPLGAIVTAQETYLARGCDV
jgi:hypothetical protein